MTVIYTSVNSLGLHFAQIDNYMVVAYADGKGYSRRKWNGKEWLLFPYGEDMPAEIERLLCRVLGVRCALDPAPLADPFYVTGPKE